MLKREDWTEYPREIPVAPGWYIVWIERNDGLGYPDISWFYSGINEFKPPFSDRRITHWSDYQSPWASFKPVGQGI